MTKPPSNDPKKDAELDLLLSVQARAQSRKLAVLTRLKEAWDLPIDEHLSELAATLAAKTREKKK